MSNVLFNIGYCNKASNRIVFKQKGFSVFFWIIPSHEMSRHFPTYTHPHSTIHELQESSVYSLYTGKYPFIGGESDVPWKEKFWIVSSRLRPYSNFPKHSRKSRITHRNANQNPGRSTHTDLRSACIYNKKK